MIYWVVYKITKVLINVAYVFSRYYRRSLLNKSLVINSLRIPYKHSSENETPVLIYILRKFTCVPRVVHCLVWWVDFMCTDRTSDACVLCLCARVRVWFCHIFMQHLHKRYGILNIKRVLYSNINVLVKC